MFVQQTQNTHHSETELQPLTIFFQSKPQA